MNMRIAIINDVTMIVKVLEHVIGTTTSHEIAWIATGGEEAVKKCKKDIPDLILMDLIMPGMNGVEATRQIMAESPCPVLIVTSSVNSNAAMVFEAMSVGAMDAVNTPIIGMAGEKKGRDALLKKISTIGKLIDNTFRNSPIKVKTQLNPHRSNEWLIAIGASTGGPSALKQILSSFPENLTAAVVIIQHVDQHFSQGLADWLKDYSKIPVHIAQKGDELTAGTVYIAGRNDHLYINEENLLDYTCDPTYTPYRPSVDVFFQSILKNWKGNTTAALLTGMGKDGAEGLLQLRNEGIYTVAQDAKSSRVYGMPKAAAELKAAVDILPIEKISKALSSKVILSSTIKTAEIK